MILYEDPSVLEINAKDPLDYLSWRCKVFSATYVPRGSELMLFASHPFAWNNNSSSNYNPNMDCMKLITGNTVFVSNIGILYAYGFKLCTCTRMKLVCSHVGLQLKLWTGAGLNGSTKSLVWFSPTIPKLAAIYCLCRLVWFVRFAQA